METDANQTVNLVTQVKHGDRKALDAIMERYLERVLRIVRVRIGPKLRSKMESMDVVQQVMVRVLNSFENFDPRDEAAFLHWLSRLVQNELSDLADYHGAQRRDGNLEVQKSGGAESPDSLIRELGASSARPSVGLQLKEDVLQLERALDELPETQREIILMRQYEGHTFKEIGAALGLSEDAARMQFARGVDKLTDIMGGINDKPA